MASAAVKAIGTALKIGDGGSPETFTTIAEIKAITGPARTSDKIEVTSMDSTGGYKEYVPGLKDGGDVTCDMNFVDSAAQDALGDDFENQTLRNFQIVTTHGTPKTIAFAAYVTNFGYSFDPTDVAKRNVTLSVTGQVTEA